MTAAILGFAAIVASALLALTGVLRTGQPPSHLADVEGLKTLADELRAERDDLRGQLTACQERTSDLEAANERLAGQLRQLRGWK